MQCETDGIKLSLAYSLVCGDLIGVTITIINTDIGIIPTTGTINIRNTQYSPA